MPSDVLTKLKSDTGFKREYRVASLFGAGSGLPATLAMMDAVLQKGLETDAVNPIPTWISYVAIDGVSAGALVTAFLTHVNILNPVEVQHELRFIRNLSAIALQNNAFDLTKRMWAIFCPTTNASMANFDSFTAWLCKQLMERRATVLENHARDREKGIPVAYPLCRVQYTDLLTGTCQKVSYREGAHGMGQSIETFFEASCASSAIPLVFECQAIGYKGAISKAAVDGGVISMGMFPNSALLSMIAVKVAGGDMFCANAKRVEDSALQEGELKMLGGRLNLSMSSVIPRVWRTLITTSCNNSISNTEDAWRKMFRGPNQCRVFRHDGTREGECKPPLEAFKARIFCEMYDIAYAATLKQVNSERNRSLDFDLPPIHQQRHVAVAAGRVAF